MKAYSKGITKDRFIAEIENHQKLDNFIKGTYSEGGKGCAVGCSIKSIAKLEHRDFHYADHQLYERYLGIPEWLAHLEDVIFEGLDIDRSKLWPLQFSKAINEGVDLDKIRVPFLIYILQSNIKVQCKQLKNKDLPKYIKDLVNRVIDIIEQTIIALEKNDTDLIEKSKLSLSEVDLLIGKLLLERLHQSSQTTACFTSGLSVESTMKSISDAIISSSESVGDTVYSVSYSLVQSVWSASRSAKEAVYKLYAKKLLNLLINCK